MLAACSTTSRPRKMSPSASSRVLPCSAVSVAASSAMFSRISCWYLRKMRARAPIGVLRQVLKARWPAETACATSSTVANGTRASTSWVAGLTTSRQTVVRDSTHSPLISKGTVGIVVVIVGLLVVFRKLAFFANCLHYSLIGNERKDVKMRGIAKLMLEFCEGCEDV